MNNPLSFDEMAHYVLDRYGSGNDAIVACKEIERNLGWDAAKMLHTVRNMKPHVEIPPPNPNTTEEVKK